LVEQIDHNLLFRWLVGLGMDDVVWNLAVFSKNRERLLNSEVAQQFFAAVNRQPRKDPQNRRFKPVSAKPSQQSLANSRHGAERQQVP